MIQEGNIAGRAVLLAGRPGTGKVWFIICNNLLLIIIIIYLLFL